MNIVVPDFSTARVLVVGDVMLDRYWHGATQRISPEAPVPVVLIQETDDRPGGAANVALNIAALGAAVSLLGVVGQDDAARSLAETVAAANIDTNLIEVEGVATITKLRVISRHQQLIRLDFEDGFSHADMGDFMQQFEVLLAKNDVVVLSDYDKGTLCNVQQLVRMARVAGKLVLVDPKRSEAESYRNATMITPNMQEFESMVGSCDGEKVLVKKGHQLIENLELEALLVTRGEQGMTLLRLGHAELHLPSYAREVFDVTGAGDTVIALTAAGLGAGASMEKAVSLANLAAGMVVSKLGTAAISAPELRRHVTLQGEASLGVVNQTQLMVAIKQARACNERLVMTNGVFDILHAGHVAYLEQARQMGERLIIAVNDDASVRRLKGAGRPVNGLERRMSVLAALSFVDWVIPFSEDTPERVICEVLPDFLVKGADYKHEEIAGGDCVRAAGGEVRVVALVGDVSTTQILQSINKTSEDEH